MRKPYKKPSPAQALNRQRFAKMSVLGSIAMASNSILLHKDVPPEAVPHTQVLAETLDILKKIYEVHYNVNKEPTNG